MYSRITDIPLCYQQGNGDLYTYSPTSARWAFNMVANWAYTRYSDMKPEIVKVQKTWEDKFNSQISAIDQQVASMNTEQAAAFLTDYSCTQAMQSTQAWKELFTYLMVKYIDGQIRKEENGQFLRNKWGEPTGPNRPTYPEEFRRLFKYEVQHE
jgi:dipeptidase